MTLCIDYDDERMRRDLEYARAAMLETTRLVREYEFEKLAKATERNSENIERSSRVAAKLKTLITK